MIQYCFRVLSSENVSRKQSSQLRTRINCLNMWLWNTWQWASAQEDVMNNPTVWGNLYKRTRTKSGTHCHINSGTQFWEHGTVFANWSEAFSQSHPPIQLQLSFWLSSKNLRYWEFVQTTRPFLSSSLTQELGARRGRSIRRRNTRWTYKNNITKFHLQFSLFHYIFRAH